MDAKTTNPEPCYTNDDEQFRARPVDDASMASWEESATAVIRHAVPGGINWTMIVRSLTAEVRRLRGNQDMLTAQRDRLVKRLRDAGLSHSLEALNGDEQRG